MVLCIESIIQAAIGTFISAAGNSIAAKIICILHV